MKAVHLLIVEDEAELLAQLEVLYREAFAARGFAAKVTHATIVHEARILARAGRERPFDLVSLDVNLGDAELSGLDVLGTLRRFQSAWMVALLTGVETDASLERTMGEERARDIRKQLRRTAYARFPAERLQVVEKPAATLPTAEAQRLLADRVGQITLLYEEISKLRYIFRPIEVVSLERVPVPRGGKPTRRFIETAALHWQIRFDCGDLRTLPDRAGLKTLHHMLALNRSESLTPEQAMVIEPRQEKRLPESVPADRDPVAKFFSDQGIVWQELSLAEQEKLIAAALSLRFKRYVELRSFEENEDLSAEEGDELDRLKQELGPLEGAAEHAYQRLNGEGANCETASMPTHQALHQEGLNTVGGGNYERPDNNRRGYDSPEARGFRKRMERMRDYLRENGFAAFATHLESHLMSTGANWSYNPPEGVEWTT